MRNGNAASDRPMLLNRGASKTRPPGDTPGARIFRGAGRTERPMDAIIKPWPKNSTATPSETPLSEHVRAAPQPVEPRPSREDAEAAVRTLIAYAGDDPKREGVLETP